MLKMITINKVHFGKLKHPVLFFLVASGGLLLHYGEPPETRPHTSFEMGVMGCGSFFLLVGLFYLVAIWAKGTAVNARQRAIISNIKQIIIEDLKQRGVDEYSQR